ncbi:MAG TPA: DUF3866 family protein [Actinomycetota bacterium]|nr:DUF3866 family protein [Actinomycetota bacterium]
MLNTTAVALGLGTGGFHVVMARIGGPVDAPGPGHVIKARYTPSQVRVLAVEEEDSPHRAAVAACTDLGGLPVVCAELHSMVPVVAAAARAVAGDLRVAYVMTDGGALPLAFSRLAAELRRGGLVAGAITAGQAFGGDLEAISLYSALAAARAEYSEMASRSPPNACPAVMAPATSPPRRSSAASREKASGSAPPSVIT